VSPTGLEPNISEKAGDAVYQSLTTTVRQYTVDYPSDSLASCYIRSTVQGHSTSHSSNSYS